MWNLKRGSTARHIYKKKKNNNNNNLKKIIVRNQIRYSLEVIFGSGYATRYCNRPSPKKIQFKAQNLMANRLLRSAQQDKVPTVWRLAKVLGSSPSCGSLADLSKGDQNWSLAPLPEGGGGQGGPGAVSITNCK